VGQQPEGTCCNDWSEFHRTNMDRWNPYENVLSVTMLGASTGSGSYTTAYGVISSPAVMNRWRRPPLQHPLAPAFARALESLCTALTPSSARHYDIVVRNFLVYLAAQAIGST
jgi:hypothetical protein